MKKIEIPKEVLRYLYFEKKLSLCLVAKKLNTTFGTIRRRLYEHNLIPRTYGEARRIACEKNRHNPKKGWEHRKKFNQYFFSSWNPQMAYTVGFLAADGYISKNRFTISFSQKDSYILQKIQEIIGQGNLYQSSSLWKLEYESQQMKSDLNDLGLTPQKTFSIKKINNAPEIFHSHITRGIFDGDGSISKSRNWSSEITSASLDFLNWIQSICPISGKIYGHKKRNIYRLRFFETDTVQFGKFIYSSPRVVNLCIPHKKKLFDQCFSEITERFHQC